MLRICMRVFISIIAVLLIGWTACLWLRAKDLEVFTYFLTDWQQLNILTWVAVLVGLIIYSAIKFIRAQGLTHATLEIYGLGIFVSLVIVTALSYVVWDDPTKIPFATLAGAMLATFGWLTSSMLTVRNQHVGAEASARASRKQHTLNILLQMRQNPEFNKHRENIYNSFPLGTPLTVADMQRINAELAGGGSPLAGGAPRVGDSLRYVTNYYEFLCAALDEGDLDEILLKKSLRRIMLKYDEKVRPYIDDSRIGAPKVYEFFLKTVNKWRAESSV